MKAVHHSDDSLKAVGITSKGEKKEFIVDNYGILFCSCNELVSLEIPEGVKYVYCNDNELKIINLPNSIEKISCDRNVLGLDKVDWECEIELF